MQRVVRNVVDAYVRPDVVVRPLRQRIEFSQRVLHVELLDCHGLARNRLFAAQPRDPRALAGKRAGERFGLADCAARLAQFHAGMKRVDAMLAHEMLQAQGVRRVDVDGNP